MAMFSAIFIDAQGTVRSGWRILLFIAVTLTIGAVLVIPVVLFGLSTDSVLRLLGVLAVLGASFASLRVFHRKPLAAVGLSLHRSTLHEFALGCLLAVFMQALMFSTMWVAGWVSVDIWDLPTHEYLATAADAVFYFLLVAMFEEVLFRGYIFQSLIQGVTFVPAVIVMALLFSLAHTRNPNVGPIGLMNVGLASVWLCVAYFKTRGLWLPIGLHFGWNFAQTTLFGHPTSGVRFADKSVVETAATGPVWVTGGEFGPEGGLLATIALLLCTWYIWQSRRVTTVEGIVTLDSPPGQRMERLVQEGESVHRESA